MRELTEEEKTEIKKLRHSRGRPMQSMHISRAMRAAGYDVSDYMVRLELGLRLSNTNRPGRYRRPYIGTSVKHVHESGPKIIPEDVIADRDRRADIPQPFLGDPKPGYSALDKKIRGAA